MEGVLLCPEAPLFIDPFCSTLINHAPELHRQLSKVASMHDTLFAKLISSKLRIPAAKRLLDEVDV